MVHAEPETALALQLGQYLERNCLVDIDYNSRVGAGQPLLETVGRALSSDVLILLVSPSTVPRRIAREEWEPLFVESAQANGTYLAYVTVADCPFPKVLLRANAFDLASGVTECARSLKRWMFEVVNPPAEYPYFVPHRPASTYRRDDMEGLWRTLGDQPGTASGVNAGAARAFASLARADFEGVFWIDAYGATLAGVAGELGSQLGLHLPGELSSNLERIRHLCSRYRCLVVLEGARPDIAGELAPLGRTSLLLANASNTEAISVDVANAFLRGLSTWMSQRNPAPASGQVRRTIEWVIRRPEQWVLASQIARAAIAYYKFHERFAEAFELLELMFDRAVHRHDKEAAAEFARERQWILESWGRPTSKAHGAAPRCPAEGTQLALW